jgi:hypothetical protein
MRSPLGFGVIAAAVLVGCKPSGPRSADILGVWVVNPELSRVPRRDLKMPEFGLTFSEKGFKSAEMETSGKWSLDGQTLVLRPARKSPVLEIVDQGKVSPSRGAQPLHFWFDADKSQLVWATQGGSAPVKPVYVFVKQKR